MNFACIFVLAKTRNSLKILCPINYPMKKRFLLSLRGTDTETIQTGTGPTQLAWTCTSLGPVHIGLCRCLNSASTDTYRLYTGTGPRKLGRSGVGLNLFGAGTAERSQETLYFKWQVFRHNNLNSA